MHTTDMFVSELASTLNQKINSLVVDTAKYKADSNNPDLDTVFKTHSVDFWYGYLTALQGIQMILHDHIDPR